MADSFAATVEAAQNTNDDGEADRWEEGDRCGEKGCDNSVKRVDHPRNPQIGTPRHPDAPETEFVCTHHGVVAKR